MKPKWAEESHRITTWFLSKGKIQPEVYTQFLSLALCGEAGELANLLKKEWRGDGEADKTKISDELADIRIYLEHLAFAFDLDLDKVCEEKLCKLRERWPEAFKRKQK